MNTIALAERRMLPDWLVRFGIRRLLATRLRQESPLATNSETLSEFAKQLKREPVAILTEKANEQHYEVPADFFQCVLGPRLKYSCCWYPDELTDLATAEEQMLRLTCERAEIEDGMRILDLGCGWGSLSLWLAQHYPHARITSISNSASQREYIQGRCHVLGLSNVEPITANVSEFDGARGFDRVVSIEMFEHVRNYEQLLRRIRGWLNPDGKLFVHIFCHRELAYRFESEGASDWMGRHFFSGGLMPAFDLFSHFQDDMRISDRWTVDGRHYARTCWDWLSNLDRREQEVLEMFAVGLGEREARLAVQRWRMFFMACAELFQYRGGTEWFVAHFLFEPNASCAAGGPILSAT
jgi:cyclopropane-fatty-acyl-phospholipid synthase